MTLNGAITELAMLQDHSMMPAIFKPSIEKVIETLVMDAKEVRHGEWIDAYPDIEPDPMFAYGICSQCRFEQSISSKLNYCPNCGAKMDGGEVNDEPICE